MIMDVGRTCGTAPCSFFRNDPRVGAIRWYRAPLGAKVFPGYSRFGLGYWANQDYDWFGPGQLLPKPLKYDKGITPPNVTGQSFCGSLQDFAEGGIYNPLLPPMPYDAYGVSTCCPGLHPPEVDDVRDINFYKQAGNSPLDVLYTGGSVTGQHPGPDFAPLDIVHALPFWPSRGGTLDELGFWLETNGSPGAKVRLAIYNNTSDTDLSPDNLIVDSGDIAADAGQGTYKTIPINVVLNPDFLYWICLNATSPGSMPVVGAMTSVFYFNALGFLRSGFASKFGVKKAMPFGPYPDPFPLLTNADLADGTIASAVVHYLN